MLNRKLSRALVAFTILAAACKPGGHEPGMKAAATTRPTVVFHMTGLLLIVPPSRVGDSTSILLPKPGDHSPVLGFGINGNVDGLCLDNEFGDTAKVHNICYVDLTTWKLEPFGDGGERTRAWKLPSFTPNVAELSGGVLTPAQTDRQITFTTGWVGPNPCSLADFTLTPAGGSASAPRPLANVVDWEIVDPTSTQLTFVRRDGTGSPKTVDLAAFDADNRVELVLANVRTSDLVDLPPMTPRPLGNAVDATDFDHYYTLLRPRDPIKPLPHVLPINGRQTAVRPCAVRITGGQMVAQTGHGVGTYGCMPATGP